MQNRSSPSTSSHSARRLGILSDTHDEIARTRLAVRVLRDAGADALVHCGDLCSPPIVEAIAALPSWFVFGNHDADVVPVLRQAAAEFGAMSLGWGDMIDFAGHRVGVVHGHLTADVQSVVAKRPHFLLSGHAHAPSDTIHGGVRRINPGALYRADAFTVATLDLLTGELILLKIET